MPFRMCYFTRGNCVGAQSVPIGIMGVVVWVMEAPWILPDLKGVIGKTA